MVAKAKFPRLSNRIGMIVISALCAAASGCAHVAGIVVYEHTHLPAAGAIVSVGEPGTPFTYQPHPADKAGKFSFFTDPLNTSNIWVAPPHGRPSLDAIHLQPSQVNGHMYVVLPNQ